MSSIFTVSGAYEETSQKEEIEAELKILNKSNRKEFVQSVIDSKKTCASQYNDDRQEEKKCFREKVKTTILNQIKYKKIARKYCQDEGLEGINHKYCVDAFLFAAQKGCNTEELDDFEYCANSITFNKETQKGKTTSEKEFAECVTDSGAVFYGTEWCPHCQNQKSYFGDGMSFIEYIDCDKNASICQEKKITGYPTWILSDGTRLMGSQKLKSISSHTGCTLGDWYNGES